MVWLICHLARSRTFDTPRLEKGSQPQFSERRATLSHFCQHYALSLVGNAAGQVLET